MKLIDRNSVVPVKKLHSLPANLICFSHLRWNFVFQRPQHLLTRMSRYMTIYFIEEPVFDATSQCFYTFKKEMDNVIVVLPHLLPGLDAGSIKTVQKTLFEQFMQKKILTDYGFWYYTPMALEFSRKYASGLVIYDCMDELSAFKFAPEELQVLEKELLKLADIVFTGGHSLYRAKRNQHDNIYPFPSSIEKEHFQKARYRSIRTPADQASLPHPQLGFYGVIDERFDIDLIAGIADARPDWHIVLIGPVVKIDPETLPRNPNIHYLGSKKYEELPEYLSSWDMALIPFLLNESTKYISPTKTPEYLAAGVPVISTPITDVVTPYGDERLVHIASEATGFIAAAEEELRRGNKERWLKKVDAFLAGNSWDDTCGNMLKLINDAVTSKTLTSIAQ